MSAFEGLCEKQLRVFARRGRDGTNLRISGLVVSWRRGKIFLGAVPTGQAAEGRDEETESILLLFPEAAMRNLQYYAGAKLRSK